MNALLESFLERMAKNHGVMPVALDLNPERSREMLVTIFTEFSQHQLYSGDIVFDRDTAFLFFVLNAFTPLIRHGDESQVLLLTAAISYHMQNEREFFEGELAKFQKAMNEKRSVIRDDIFGPENNQ